jgi:trehalose/maltose hydrolase-like predicted phosphorylase
MESSQSLPRTSAGFVNAPMSPAPVGGTEGDGLPAYLSNGVIGLRVRGNPLQRGMAVVNGLAGMHPHTLVECSPSAPYPLQADIRVGRVWLSDVWHRVEDVEQTYDFGSAELHSTLRFSLDGVRAIVTALTFCSRSHPSLVAQEVCVEFDADVEVALRALLDPGDIAGRWAERWHELPIDNGEAIDGALRWEMLDGLSTCGAAYTSEFLGSVDAHVDRPERGREGPLCTTYSFDARRGRSYRLRQITALVPSQTHAQPDLQAARLVALGGELGFDELRRQNRSAWDELWRGRVNVVGADSRWQGLADAAFFYLHSSTHPSSHASTSIFGLAQWTDYHYYYGHVMWDIEAFAIPPLLLTQPDAARALLEFRARGLEAARANARMNGFRGLQFPWEASPARSEEAAPGAGDAASFEHHVSMDVAHASAQYVYATGDEWFMRDRAWPVLAGVAQWITSRVTKSNRGYEIRRAMGIAERTKPSDNVAFVNMTATVALREAVTFARQLGYQPPAEWTDVANSIVIPSDPRQDVILDHDCYNPDEEKGATPAVLAGLFPLGYQVDPTVERATIQYYLNLADQYIGSPMLSALYGVWATRVGDRARAADLLEEGYAKFSDPRFMNVHEYRPDKFPEQPIAGPFCANLSGFLLGCIYGYPGLHLNDGPPDTWCARPVVMPKGFDGIEIDRIWVRGRPAHLSATHGADRAHIDQLD